MCAFGGAGGVSMLQQGGCIHAAAGGCIHTAAGEGGASWMHPRPPPPHGQTDACENITFPNILYAVGKKLQTVKNL